MSEGGLLSVGELGQKVRHFQGCQGCFLALVPDGSPRTVERLLQGVASQQSESDGNVVVECQLPESFGHLSIDVFIMGRFPFDDCTQAYNGAIVLAFRKPLGGNRQFPSPWNPCNVNLVARDFMLIQRLESPVQESLSDRRVIA